MLWLFARLAFAICQQLPSLPCDFPFLSGFKVGFRLVPREGAKLQLTGFCFRRCDKLAHGSDARRFTCD